MEPTQLTCQIRIKRAEGQDSGLAVMRDCPDVGLEVRRQWAHEVMKYFSVPHDRIRPWNFLARLDGSVEQLALPSSIGDVYPARFQIPPSRLGELDGEEKVRRAEMFALASLLYEIMSGTKPFEDLADEEVQRRFADGEFPHDATSLPCSGWSEGFSQGPTRRTEAQDVNILQRLRSYAKNHPVRTGIQIVGLGLFAVSFCAVPVLGAVGFAAGGPAAGSAVTMWQASIGAVEAGSLFAWCQSAAMGGAALSGIQIAGVAGVAGAALTRVTDIPGLVKAFKSGRNPPAMRLR